MNMMDGLDGFEDGMVDIDGIEVPADLEEGLDEMLSIFNEMQEEMQEGINQI